MSDSRLGPNRTHGIRATFVDGCRCHDCRMAQRAYDRKRHNVEAYRKHTPKPYEWMASAACRDHPNPNWWWAWEAVHKYGQHNAEQMTDAAIKVCLACPVIEHCREYAYMAPKEEFGVWAGETAKERGGRRRRKGKGNKWIEV